MMNLYNIMEMIRLGEGWNIEFKEVIPKPSKLAQTIVAFANHQGGTILIGVSDRGDIVGFEPSKKDYDNILRAAREAVNPSIRYEEIKLPAMIDTGASFIFTLYSKLIVSGLNKDFDNLKSRQKRAIEYVRERGAITNREYRSINSVSNVSAALELQALVKKGILRKEGKGRTTQYVIDQEVND